MATVPLPGRDRYEKLAHHLCSPYSQIPPGRSTLLAHKNDEQRHNRQTSMVCIVIDHFCTNIVHPLFAVVPLFLAITTIETLPFAVIPTAV